MKNRLFSSLLIMVAIVGIVSCSKVGAPGADGANGANGATGATGSAGATGATGAAGPDSVLYSAPITLQMTTTSNAEFGTYYVDTIAVPAITASVIANDAISGYIYYPTEFGDSSWLSINQRYYFLIDQYVTPGKIVVACYGEFTTGGDISGFKYRFVIVPGSIATSGNTKNQIKTN